MRVILNQESSGGGGVTPAVNEQNPENVSHAPPPAPPAAAPAGAAAPPAAATVISGEITEETERLRVENDALKKTVKQREQEHASVSDEFKRYKDTVEARAVPVNQGTVPAKGRRFLRR